MENLINLVIWCLVVFSMCNALAVSTALKLVRDFFYPSGIHEMEEGKWVIYDKEKEDWVDTDKRPVPFFGKLIICPMCLGFWFGMILGASWLSPTGSLILDGFLGSITSWLLYLSIQQKQQIGNYQG